MRLEAREAKTLLMKSNGKVRSIKLLIVAGLLFSVSSEKRSVRKSENTYTDAQIIESQDWERTPMEAKFRRHLKGKKNLSLDELY